MAWIEALKGCAVSEMGAGVEVSEALGSQVKRIGVAAMAASVMESCMG